MFNVTLKNYRGFECEEFDFSKINILIGENSSGKSSMFKFFLALKQSFITPNNRELNFTFSGAETDLGTYKDAVRNHQNHQRLGFNFKFGNEYFEYFFKTVAFAVKQKSKEEDEKLQHNIENLRDNIKKTLRINFDKPVVLEIEMNENLDKHENVEIKISYEGIGELQIISQNSTETDAEGIYLIGKNPQCQIKFVDKNGKNHVFENIDYEKQAFLSVVALESLRKSPKVSEKVFWQIAFLLEVETFLQMQIANIEYINSILTEPDRLYVKQDSKNLHQANTIELTIEFLSKATEDFLKEFVEILKEFGLVQNIHIKQHPMGLTKELCVTIDGLESNIKDVGYGVTLQLPIIAQAMISEHYKIAKGTELIKRGKTLFIEQPEVHLHPKLQANFIETLLKIGRNNVYFIETHSEHIVRKLQVMVKEGKLTAEDVAIYYMQRKDGKMVATKHFIDAESGRLKPVFPEGFYDVSYDLAFQLLE